jgi:hypothetical protein
VNRIVSDIKQKVVALYGDFPGPRKILSGPNRGLKMNLGLGSDSQTYVGVAERELFKFFKQLSKGIETAVDVGSSVGFYTLFFLERTPAKVVYGFEPDPACQEKIASNLRLNGLEHDGRLRLIKKFVGSKDDDEHVSLDSLADQILSPCLIKIDVEGAEVDVLEGAHRLLRRPGVRWIIETHAAELEEQCIAVVTRAGLSHQIVDKAWWRAILPEMRPSAHNRWLIAW